MRTTSIVLVLLVLLARATSADPRRDYIDAVGAATGDIVQPTVLDKLVTFKVGAKCWTKLADKDLKGIYTGYTLAHHIVDWAKVVTGDDWWELERKTGIEADTKREMLEEKIEAFKTHFRMTIAIDGDDCNPKNNSHHVVAWEVIGGALRDHPPKSGKAFITLAFKANAKKRVAATSKDGTTFTITMPRDAEPDVWQRPIQDAFQKVAKKR